jgi:hypothetical protein
MVAEIIERNREEIEALCRKYRVQRLDIFGSAATGEFDERSSDVDFLVTFEDPEEGILYRYLDLADDLERLLKRKVDLLTERSVGSQGFRSQVERQRTPIYA